MENGRLQLLLTPAEFGQFFSEFKPRFVAVACRYVRNAAVAEDIVSDSFMAFWEIRESLPADINIPAYILTSVKNRCLNHLNAQLRHRLAEQDLHSTRQRLLMADVRSLSACDPDRIFSKEIRLLSGGAIARHSSFTLSACAFSYRWAQTFSR